MASKRMGSKQDRKKMNVEEDGLSRLPDELIHKILSFLSTKHVVETSALSSRWRLIWTSMPYLNFSSEDFPSLTKFTTFVKSVLSRRNDQIEVTSLTLRLNTRVISPALLKRIVNYAFNHNVQRMSIICQIDKKIEIPLSLFCSQSLKHLTLIGSIDQSIALTWELPALTALHLSYVTLYDDGVGGDGVCDGNELSIISMCPNLKNLTLDGCRIMGWKSFKIFHPQLANLTLKNGTWGWNTVYVVAPQLKRFTMVRCDRVSLSAPDLTCFTFRSNLALDISMDAVPSLEEADLRIRTPVNAYLVSRLLQQFHNVISLTLNLEIIQLLSSSWGLLNQPSPFANLRSLKIYPLKIQLEGHEQKKVYMSTEVKKYLLDGSSSASFTLVTPEEIKARDSTLAQHLMVELQLMLEWEEAIINDRHMTWENPHMISYGGDFEKPKIRDITSKLQHIGSLLRRVPTSNRSKLQSNFSSLCAEANIVMKKLDRTYIPHNIQGAI